MRKKLEESGSEEAAAIIESSRQEIMNLKNRVGRELEDQISAAKAHVKKESEALAVVIMEKVLDRRLQP
jgi:F-type H+-transporting ATPase subunit b